MTTHRTILGLREALEPLRAGARIGLVPTMGALHAGHEALIAGRARSATSSWRASSSTLRSSARGEDLDRYPRDEDGDAELAAGWGVDHLFVPSVAEMYPQGFQTWVDVEALAEDLEGGGRPGHFRGVATVCLKLFNIVGPDVAYFGRRTLSRPRSSSAWSATSTCRSDPGRARPCATPTAWRTARATPTSRLRSARRQGRSPVRWQREPRRTGPARTRPRPRRRSSPASRCSIPSTSRLRGWTGALYLLAAVRVGRTRLIDNVVLEGDAE